jgi:hypothetical protein
MDATLYPQTASVIVSPEELSWLFMFVRTVTEFTNKYLLGAVIILGIGGNILSIFIFWRCRSKDQVTVTYLAPLAVADLATLFYGAFSWVVSGILGKTNGYFFFIEVLSFGPQVVCKVFRYQHRVCSCISSYLIVMFSLERCLGVWFPIKIHILMTRRRRRFMIGLMVVTMLVLSIPILVYYRVHYWSGTIDIACFFDVPELTNVQKYWMIEIIDKILPHKLPCVLILLLNILIIVGVWSARQNVSGKIIMNKADSNGLISLLFISLLYLITTLPYVIVWGICDYFSYIVDGFIGFSSEEVQVILMLGFFTTSFSMLNYCFNFLIYASSLKIFKDELKYLVNVI